MMMTLLHSHDRRQDSIAALLSGGQDPMRLIVVLPAHLGSRYGVLNLRD